MAYFERAEALKPAGNDDAVLRWNTCVRMLAKHHLVPASEAETFEPVLLE